MSGEKSGIDIEKIAIAAAVIVGGYLVLKTFGFLKSAGTAIVGAAQSALSSAQNALSSGLYRVFGPNDAAALGDMLYYTVTFPSGARHSIASSIVNSSGQFDYSASDISSDLSQSHWQLLVGADGGHYAAPA